MDFIELLFRTSRYLRGFRESVYGVTEGMSPLYTKDFYRIPLLMPSLATQASVVDRIRGESAALMLGMSKLSREIELINEFRKRLVADVVTGQVDVRTIAAMLPDDTTQVASFDVVATELDDLLEHSDGNFDVE